MQSFIEPNTATPLSGSQSSPGPSLLSPQNPPVVTSLQPEVSIWQFVHFKLPLTKVFEYETQVPSRLPKLVPSHDSAASMNPLPQVTF